MNEKPDDLVDKLDELLEAIARKHLSVNTLKVQGSDRLDFHECSVISIREALKAAFLAGTEVGLSPK